MLKLISIYIKISITLILLTTCVENKTTLKKESLKKESLKKESLKKESLKKESLKKESLKKTRIPKQITRQSKISSLHYLKQFYSIPNFKLGGKYNIDNTANYKFGGEGGITLESLNQSALKLAYIPVGTPKKNKDGKIINAIIINSYYSGDSTSMYNFWYDKQKGNSFAGGSIIGPGKLIDTNKYYVIFLDAIGLWGTSKPSDGLGMKFPKYSAIDAVQANYLLLKKLGIAKVKLSTGVSMGAMQSYLWATLYPEFVEAILPIGGAVYLDSVTLWLFQLMSSAMKSDPVWQKTKGDYYHLEKNKHPNKGMMFGWSILLQTILSLDLRSSQPWSQVKKEVFFWNPKNNESENLQSKAVDYDVNDLLYLNKAGYTYDIKDKLNRIKAKTLIVHVKNDQWLRFTKAQETSKKIKGAKLISFSDILSHQANFKAPNVLKKEIKKFINSISK